MTITSRLVLNSNHYFVQFCYKWCLEVFLGKIRLAWKCLVKDKNCGLFGQSMTGNFCQVLMLRRQRHLQRYAVLNVFHLVANVAVDVVVVDVRNGLALKQSGMVENVEAAVRIEVFENHVSLSEIKEEKEMRNIPKRQSVHALVLSMSVTHLLHQRKFAGFWSKIIGAT